MQVIENDLVASYIVEDQAVSSIRHYRIPPSPPLFHVYYCK
jgi:hypothetical protein